MMPNFRLGLRHKNVFVNKFFGGRRCDVKCRQFSGDKRF